MFANAKDGFLSSDPLILIILTPIDPEDQQHYQRRAKVRIGNKTM